MSDLTTNSDHQYKSDKRQKLERSDFKIKKDIEMMIKEKDIMNDKYAEMVQMMKLTQDEVKLLKGENENLKATK